MTVFDATQHEPQQIGGKHPPGNKFSFTITNTEVKDTKAKDGQKLFEVTFTSPAGQIRNNYNLWNSNDQARKISVGQLSALCHATGIFKVNFKDPISEGPDGRELIGGKGLMDVNFQDGHQPSAEKPEGGYVEVKKVYDVNGNEPGQAKPAAQTTSGFANAQQAPQPQIQQGWGGAAPQSVSGQAAINQPNPAGGWQQGAGAGEKPPWG